MVRFSVQLCLVCVRHACNDPYTFKNNVIDKDGLHFQESFSM